jgi:hypothetical protein
MPAQDMGGARNNAPVVPLAAQAVSLTDASKMIESYKKVPRIHNGVGGLAWGQQSPLEG